MSRTHHAHAARPEERVPRAARTWAARRPRTRCTTCRGQAATTTRVCPTCDGTGLHPATATLAGAGTYWVLAP